jgi:predicted nucleic acid-binding protein
VAARLASAEVVWPGPELLNAYVDLRVACERVGHALGQRGHDPDRWIAATALHLGVPLISHDGIFHGVPGLAFETALDGS